MVGSVGLDVAVILVEAQPGLNLGCGAHLGITHERLVLPWVAALAVVEDLGGAWVEDNPVQGDAPGRHHPAGRATFSGLRLGRDFKTIFLLRDGVGVSPVGERRDLVVGDAIRLDYALVALHGEGDLVLAGRVGAGFLKGWSLGAVGGDQRSGGEEKAKGRVHGGVGKGYQISG